MQEPLGWPLRLNRHGLVLGGSARPETPGGLLRALAGVAPAAARGWPGEPGGVGGGAVAMDGTVVRYRADPPTARTGWAWRAARVRAGFCTSSASRRKLSWAPAGSLRLYVRASSNFSRVR
jgi:hypothetical protein